MGYSHYWRYTGAHPIEYTCRLAEAQHVVMACTDAYNLEVYDVDRGIWFSGPLDEACEDFGLGDDGADPVDFACCKTWQWPYDDVVTACLLVMSQVPGFRIFSDGLVTEWEQGQALVSTHLGYDVDVVFDDKWLKPL